MAVDFKPVLGDELDVELDAQELAGVAQGSEHRVANAETEGSNPSSRSITFRQRMTAIVDQAGVLLEASKKQLAAAEAHLDAVRKAMREIE